MTKTILEKASKILKLSDQPCLYGIQFFQDYHRSWKDPHLPYKKPCFVIYIHKKFIEEFEPKPKIDSSMLKIIEEDFGFNDFNFDFTGDIGFKDIIKNYGELEDSVFVGDNFVRFVAYLPLKKLWDWDRKKEGYTCSVCQYWVRQETKSNGCSDIGCPECLYTGHGYKDNPNLEEEINLTVTSLAVLFDLLRMSKCDTDSEQKQLFSVEMIAKRQEGASAIFGTFSPFLVNYLHNQIIPFDFAKVVDTMWYAYTHMVKMVDESNRESFQRCFYQSKLHNKGWLTLACPTGFPAFDVSSIFPSDFDESRNVGYNFSSKDVNFTSMLVLLAGLAETHYITRFWNWNK